MATDNTIYGSNGTVDALGTYRNAGMASTSSSAC